MSGTTDEFPDLVVRQSSISNKGAIDLLWTPDLKRYRSTIKKVMQKYVNPRRGHGNVPMITGPSKKIQPGDLEDFDDDPFDTEDQFDNDEISVHVRTADNRFFYRTLRDNELDPGDPIIRVVRYAFGPCSTIDDVVFCTSFIDEFDVFYRAREIREIRSADGSREDFVISGFFEDVSAFRQDLLIAAAVKFGVGHRGDSWAHSLRGGERSQVTQKDFNRGASDTWRESKESDQRIYGSGIGVRGSTAAPFLQPAPGSLIELEELEVPEFFEALSVRSNASRIEILVQTDLKGFSNKKQLTVEIFEGNSTRSPDRIIQISGSSIDRNLTTTSGKDAVRAYRLSQAGIGDPEAYEALRDAVVDKGDQDVVIRNVRYDRVLDVTIKVTGYLTETGGKQSVTQQYKLVYDIPPGSWAAWCACSAVPCA